MLRGCSEQVLGAGDMTWTVPRCHGLCQAGEEKRGQNWEMPPARGGLFRFILSGSNTSPGRLSSRLARRAGGGFEAESCQAPSETEARALAVGGDSQVPYIICSAREVNTGHCHCQQEAPRAEQPARVTSWCVGWGWGIPLHQGPPPRGIHSGPGCPFRGVGKPRLRREVECHLCVTPSRLGPARLPAERCPRVLGGCPLCSLEQPCCKGPAPPQGRSPCPEPRWRAGWEPPLQRGPWVLVSL